MNPSPKVTYLVCATMRSGSSLLSRGLGDLGFAGRPDEFFISQNRAQRSLTWRVSTLEDYIRCLLEKESTSNGVFGAKIMWPVFQNLLKELRKIPRYRGLPSSKILAEVFPNIHYIYLARRDKIRQAVSCVKAIQTNQWHKIEENVLSDPRLTKRGLKFCFGDIHHFVKEFTAEDDAWKRFFADNGLHAHHVSYEELRDSYEDAVHSVLRYLNIPCPVGFTLPGSRMQRLSDSLNEEWVEKYLHSRRALPFLLFLEIAYGLKYKCGSFLLGVKSRLGRSGRPLKVS